MPSHSAQQATMSDRRTARIPTQRASLAPSAVQRLKPPNDKSSRASIATSSPTKSTYAQKTQSSNSRLNNSSEPVSMEETNISVYVRCRSRNDREIKENSGVVVSTMGHNGKEVVLQTGPMSVSNKTYTFDRVFGAESDQEMVYDGIAKGVLQEMLQGYNCTVFAYGQTGTGKTYTMSGDIEMAGNRLSENSGIIPRTLVDLFKSLEKSTDFSVKVSFIELYNEELKDLLLTNESEERKVRIFEDPNKKTIMVQGMEEIYIKTAAEGMKVLSDGSYNRQVASTKCNDLSSRSHSVFTITVHMKEIDPISGEEYLKIGKLNLVDLAGSENINRSGAENKRAREAGMINQSLLTLGRVINALVDQSPHIPYRESKLTRLLQDSLGGKTKTCIIATVSPAKVSLEETISTLEYANRAKSIKNKPQVNQSMSKKMLIKEYVEEIERLRNDLNATRNKNGIYVTEENMEKITAESESRRILVEEQKLRMSLLEEQLKKLKRDFQDQLKKFNDVEETIHTMKEEKETLEDELRQVNDKLYQAECELRVESLVSKNSSDVIDEVSILHGLLTKTLQDVMHTRDELHILLDKKQTLEVENNQILKDSKVSIVQQTSSMNEDVNRLFEDNALLGKDLNDNFQAMVKNQQSKIEKKCTEIRSFGSKLEKQVQSSIEKVFEKSQKMSVGIDGIESVKKEITDAVMLSLDELKKATDETTREIIGDVHNIGNDVLQIHKGLDEDIQNCLSTIHKQIGAQAEEIVSLSAKLLHYQANHQQLLEQEVKKLEILEEEEHKRSGLEKEELLQQIYTLVNEHENKRLQALHSGINEVVPSIRSVSEKQANFGDTFNSFIKDGWLVTQNKFRDQLDTESHKFHRRFDSATHELKDKHLGKLVSSLQVQQSRGCQSLSKVADDLSAKMTTVDEFTKTLKSLNEENHEFTKSQLTDISSQTKRSFGAITQTFERLGSNLADAKPQLVDSYLQKQDKFISSFKDATVTNLTNLDSYVSSIQYNEDDTQPPKRQKITYTTQLPRPQTREQIVKLHKDVIYPPRAIEKTQMIPVPDRAFKQPLSELRPMSINVMRDETTTEKHKTRLSRPSSSSSTISLER